MSQALEWQTSAFDALTPAILYRAIKLRQDIFILEQECLYTDLDDLDQQATHMLCWRAGALVAYQRCLPPGVSYPESSIGRIIVTPEVRGIQLGRQLVQRGIDYNLAQWPDHDIKIGAQSHLQPFYNSLGFTTVGEEYLEDGIMHAPMLYQR
ncbi:MAG: GNAT family N-acetyltransferase [Halieaceae bacterium]